jgi:hypothetical protein
MSVWVGNVPGLKRYRAGVDLIRRYPLRLKVSGGFRGER